jgi:hypothetical protein
MKGNYFWKQILGGIFVTIAMAAFRIWCKKPEL